MPAATVTAGSDTTTSPVRVLVVDDTALYRKILKETCQAIEGIEVLGVASNGKLALQQIHQLKPDFVTLDIEMPEMNGIEVLRELRKTQSTASVVVVSSHTQEGAELTIQALQEGAFDFIIKPTCSSLDEAARQLRVAIEQRIQAHLQTRKTKTPARAPLPTPTPSAPPENTNAKPVPWVCEAVAIGISTGGPEALRRVIPLLPGDLPVPVYIVQHMPPVFTKSLATSLNSLSQLTVVEAENNTQAKSRHVYIAPGGKQMRVVRESSGAVIQITDDPPELSCQPSVDYLFRSIARAYRRNTLGIIMTGMGSDGTEGSLLLKRIGARIICQEEKSCVVWGMPRQLTIDGVPDEIVPLDQMADTITRHVCGGKSA